MDPIEIQNSVPAKWQGKVSAKLQKASADQVWAFYKDFFCIHKWSNGITSCSGVSGTNGEPGCIRHLIFAAPGSDATDGWAKERLVAVADEERSLSYEMVENNVGLNSYVSTVKIVPLGEGGCVIEWGFSVDPVEGWTLDNFVSKVYEAGLQVTALRMDDAAAASI